VEGIETGTFGFKRLRPAIKTVIRLHGERYTFAKYTPPGHIPIDIRLSRYFQRKAFLNSNQLTAPSEDHAQEIGLELKGKGPSIRVIPNPVRVFNIERAEEKNPTRPIFLYIGRLQMTKGILDLLKVIPLIRRKVPDAAFIIVGKEHPSVSKEQIRSSIDELGIEGAIQFLGHVDIGDLSSLYLKATAVVLPSYYESFGYVPLEALMHGIPVVAYDAGAVKNIIKNGENGFLVPPGDISALADACIKAVNIEVKPPDMDEISKYAVERVCSETISVYENLLRNN
jgi:glycosyltransferase involved in cell wall biosynthesis